MNEGLTRVVNALRDAGLLVSARGDFPLEIPAITDDSRAVTDGVCFIAVRGSVQDGHKWLRDAADRGAGLAIVEDPGDVLLPCIVVNDSRRAVAIAAAAWFNWPSRRLRIVGVTGTNGKTTTTGVLRHLLETGGLKAASIGTLGTLIGSPGELVPGSAGLTTPGPVALQSVLADLVARGVQAVAMEVSSHALDQHRVDGVTFSAAVFTNLTRDHLDYHGTMEAYLSAKLRLALLLAPDGAAIVNADDPAWHVVPAARHISFGVSGPADVMAREISYGPEGARFMLVTNDGAEWTSSPLVGDFNVLNVLGAATAAMALGVPLSVAAAALPGVPQVNGRLERISDAPTVLRDYAHTPDALERVLTAVRLFAPGGRVIVLFGCGGDRDRGKRPVMGHIAERLADAVILTSDNPRTEDPERILDDIEAGMEQTESRHVRIADREEAIRYALSIAGSADVVLLAGKGHETYQIRGTVSYPFDERIIVERIKGSGAG